jgi:hypothetical protein
MAMAVPQAPAGKMQKFMLADLGLRGAFGKPDIQ